MKTCVLFGVIIALLSGCLHHSPYYYSHDVTITLKDGMPCFGLADDEQILSEQFNIFTVSVSRNVANQLPKLMMSKNLNGNTLQSGECIPYEGVALESDTIYGITIGGYFIKQRPNDSHNYDGGFCLSEKKNGEKVLHHFKEREQPTSCPISSNE